MLAPGRIEIGTTLQLRVELTDQDGVLTDPGGVIFKTRSACGTETTYTYGEDDEIERDSAGIYLANIVPDEAGRWNFRWETTGPVYVTAGTFLVQASPFSAFNDTWWTGGYWYW
jgi:hypothetical protein